MRKIIVKKQESGQTILKYIKKFFNNATLNFIEKIFRKKKIVINEKKVDKKYVLQENDIIKIFVSEEQIKKINKVFPISETHILPKIIYEDDNILIVNKPKGLLCHSDKTETLKTLINQVTSYIAKKDKEINLRLFKPVLCHRLDFNTSGLIIIAKNIKAAQTMEQIFKNQKINKYYLVLVFGQLKKNGLINKPLIKINDHVKIDAKGKKSITKFHIIKKFKNFTLIEALLVTGRTHQIRVHLASIGFPVVGDNKYGDFKQNRIFKKQFNYNSQFLHAYKIQFENVPNPLQYLSHKIFKADLNNKEKTILNFLK